MNREKWNRLAGRFKSAVCDITATDQNRVLHRLVQKSLHRRSQPVLVELGCGIGTFISKFGPQFGEVCGVDYSPRMLGKAKSRCAFLPHARWLCSSVERAPRLLGRVADLTSCLNVITSPTASRREAQWASVAATTKTGGFALIVVPSVESEQMVATLGQPGQVGETPVESRSGLTYRGKTLQKFYSRPELNETIERHGLLVHTLTPVHYPWTEEGVSPKHGGLDTYPWDWGCLAYHPIRAF